MPDSDVRDPRAGAARVLPTIVVCALLLAGAAAASWAIFASEPTAQSERATRRSAALVETVVARRGTHPPVLEVLGEVRAARAIDFGPRVRGQVVARSDDLEPGAIVRAGAELLRLDPADFELSVTARRSELEQVRAELAIEEGLQVVARQEYELLGEGIDPENRSLVLREPQIASIRARLEGAEAALAQAELELGRTRLLAPFDAQVLEPEVHVGSQLAPGDRVARLVGVEEYWIFASVPMRDLRWLRFPEGGEPGSPVRVRHATAWPDGVHREARLARRVGTVDDRTRLARVLVSVSDPLGLDDGAPPLVLGSLVQLELVGVPLEDVVRLDRDLLRQGDTVWVMVDDALQVRTVELAHRDGRYAYVRSGVEEGEHVVVTDLATVGDGLPLRRVAPDASDGAASE